MVKKQAHATPQEVWDLLREFQKETDRQIKENDRGFKELRESQMETDRQMKETDNRLNKLNDLFTGQWGKLIETLVEGDLIKLLKEKNIKVERTHQNIKGKFEIDILAVNGEEIVVVEVKTTLRLKDVNYFIEKLEKFKTAFPEYKNKKIYGAVAYLKSNEGSDKNSEKKGLFVIRATGGSASISNAPNFNPRKF